MRAISRLFCALLFFCLLFPQPSQLSSSPLDSKFKNRVKTIKRFSGAVEKWFPIASTLSADPLYVALGLKSIKFSKDNEFIHSTTLTIDGATFNFKGTLKFNPNPVPGQPIASLLSGTVGPVSGQLKNIVNLHARSASLDVVIMPKGGQNKVYARIKPDFTNVKSKPAPYLFLSHSATGFDYTLMGGKLTLSNFIPEASQVSFLDKFAYSSMKRVGTKVTIKGSIDNKDVSVENNILTKTFVLTGKGLNLADIIPETARIPYLNQFSFNSLTHAANTLTIHGSVSGKALTVTKDLTQKSFNVTGSAQLSDFIPAISNVPVLKRFSFGGLTVDSDNLTVTGEMGGKSSTVVWNRADKTFNVTGLALTLANFVPAVSNVSFLNKFSFKHLDYTGTGIKVAGTINNGAVNVSQDSGSKNFSVTGSDLKLTNFIPSAANISFLNSFSFDELSRTPTQSMIKGKISGKSVSVTEGTSADSFSVTGSDLTLPDFIPDTTKVPFLKKFDFDSLASSASGINVSGQINSKPLSVKVAEGAKTFSVTGANLKLTDFIPETSQVPFLKTFALEGVVRTATQLEVKGKVNSKAVTVTDSLTDNTFAVTGDAITLADFIPSVSAVPFLKEFGFKGLSHTADGITVAGLIDAKSVQVEQEIGKKGFKVTGASLKLSDFIPSTTKVSFLNSFTFTNLTHENTALTVAGTINTKNVSVTLDTVKKTFSVKGGSLQLSDFVPDVANVPFLGTFDFIGLSETANGVEVDGTIDSKAITVDRNRTTKAFVVTGASLKLSDFVPEASGVAFLNSFSFKSLAHSANQLDIEGQIDGKNVSVKKDVSKKSFRVTGADLTLADFIPDVSAISFLNKFAFDQLTITPTETTVEGKISAKSVFVVRNTGEQSFTLTGQDLRVANFVPSVSEIPFLDTFAFDRLVHTEGEIDVAGKIDGKAVSVKKVLAKKSFEVTGASLKLSDFIPSAGNVSFLKNFTFTSLTHESTQLTVAGTIDSKDVSVTFDSAKKTFAVTGGSLKLSDFVPEVSNVPFLGTFAFLSLNETANGVKVNGTIDSKGVTVDRNRTTKAFTVTGASLKLSDFIPEVSGVSFLNNFAFKSLMHSANQLDVEGAIDEKNVAVKKDTTKKSFSVTGADLTLSDFIPDVSAIAFLNKFAFDELTHTPTETTVEGKINAKPVSVVHNTSEKSFTLTGQDLTVADFVPSVSAVPFLNTFAFDSLVHTEGEIDVAGKIDGKAVSVKKVLAKKTFEVTGADLELTDFVPSAKDITFLNKFAFDDFTYSPTQFSIKGKINTKPVRVVENSANKTFKVTGADLKLTDFIPSAANVPFLSSFAFDSLSYSTAAITVDGKISGAGVSVARKLGATGSFTAKGDDLKLSDIAPEAGGLKAFDNLALDLVSVSPSAIEIDGKISGKSIKFVRTRGAKPTVTVTAGGLVLSDLFTPLANLPAINSVAIDKITLDGVSIEVEAELNGDKVDVIAHAKQGQNSSYVAIFIDTLDAATFIPAAKGHAVNDISLEKALFVIQPAGSAATTVTASDLPGDLPNLVGWSAKDTLNLSGGVNIAADLNVSKSGAVAEALKTVGIPAGSLPLKGTLSASTFKAMTGKSKGSAQSLSPSDKQSILAGLDISANLPIPNLPAIAGMVTVSGPVTLSIGGDAQSATGIWSKLPPSLSSAKPAGDLDISVQFGVDIVGAGINEKLDAVVSLDKGAQSGLSLIALYDGTWNKPFGIEGLTLASGGFRFSLEKTATTTTEDLQFFASANIGQKKNVTVSADLSRTNKKLSLNYFELDGSFGLGDLPGGKNIPNAEKFTLDTVKISKHGVEAKTTFSGVKVDAFLFDTGAAGTPNWTFAIDQKNFKISEVLPAAKNIPPLASLSIPKAALIISEKGISGNRATMGVIAKDMFDDIFGKSNVSFKIPSGIGVLAAFDSAAMGLLGEGLNKIGVHEEAIIMGAITGIFQGTPGISLSLAMETPGEANGLPQKVMSFKDGVEPSFFIQWSGDEIDVGLKIAMDVKAGKDDLELATSIEVEFTEEGLGIKVLGEMDGIWHSPFGIHALSLANLKMDVSINDVGEVKIGFAGDEQFGNCQDESSPECLDINIAAEMSIALEDLLPDGVAFAAKANQLGIPAILDIAETLLGLPGGLSKLPIPFFEIKNALLAFATPGATDPQLGLVSEGFAFGGTFVFMNKELGSVSGSGGPTSGFKFDGKIDDINLEILEFKKNNVDIAINQSPKFIIDSDIELLGAEQTVKLDIEPPHFEFDLTENLGVFGKAALTVRLDGFDLTKGTFDKNADISVVGVFESTLVPWMEKEIRKGIEDLRKSANAKLEADSRALEAAQKKVDGINDQIRKIRQQDQRAKKRAEAKLDAVKRRVSSLRSKYDHDKHEAHHCGSRWTHWACSPGWYAAAAATWAVYKVAEGALDAAKKIVAAAYDLDPRIAGLIAERDVAHAALSVADAVVKASEAVENFVLKELETILEEALAHLPFEIEKAIIIGDLRDMILHDDPLVFDMKFKMFGDEMHEYFAVKIPDKPKNIEFDAVSFALLPAIALDKLTEDALKKLSPAAGRWIHAHIGAKLAAAEEKVRQQVQAEEAKFKDVLDSLENGNAKYKKAFADQAAEHLKLVEQTNITDLMPDSLEYKDIYLAIGHSNHCLTVSKDGVKVIQAECKDTDAGRWTTKKLKDGYVQLKSKGLCLKARKGDKTDNFEPLILAQCDKDDKHEQWKIVSADGFYDKIVNRDSQKCLHFNEEDANPRSAYAVWTSCLGADSQTFRPITDAEKPTWHPVKSMVKAENGLCLDVEEAPGQKDTVTLTATKKKKKLVASKCDDKSLKFNYLEEVNGDIKLIDAESGYCVYPQANSTKLALRACDRGKDMIWQINSKTGSADQFFNPYKNLCMMLPAPPKNSKAVLDASMASCNKVPNDSLLLDLVQ